MIKLEQLKQRFPIENVPPYGECIVVPGAEFDPDWEGFLDEQGYGCIFTDFGEKPVTLVLTKKRQPEPQTPQPPRKPLSAMKGPLWTKENEDRLIKRVSELKGSLEGKCTILTKEFQGRSANGLLQKFKKLVRARRALPGKRGRPKKVLGTKGLDKALENVCPDCGLPKDLCCCDEEKKESLRAGGDHVPHSFTKETFESQLRLECLVQDIRDLLCSEPKSFYFKWHCRKCRQTGTADDQKEVWRVCPVCLEPLIVWNVQETSS